MDGALKLFAAFGRFGFDFGVIKNMIRGQGRTDLAVSDC